jgi:hypothetical protein
MIRVEMIFNHDHFKFYNLKKKLNLNNNENIDPWSILSKFLEIVTFSSSIDKYYTNSHL